MMGTVSSRKLTSDTFESQKYPRKLYTDAVPCDSIAELSWNRLVYDTTDELGIFGI